MPSRLETKRPGARFGEGLVAVGHGPSRYTRHARPSQCGRARRSSAATGFPSPAPTGRTPTPPTRRCSPRRSTGWSRASTSRSERLGEVVAGAVLKHCARLQPHARVRARQRARPRHPRLRHPAGLRHRPRGRRCWWPTRSRSARSTCGIAGGVDTTSDAPIEVNDDLRRVLLDVNAAKSAGERVKLLGRLRPGQIVPEIPRNAEPRTGLSMGEHTGDHRARVGHHARGAGRAGRGEPPEPGRGLRARLLRRPRDALPRPRARREPAPGRQRREAGEAQAGLRPTTATGR